MKKILRILPILCALVFAGCAHERVLVDVQHPEIELTPDKVILFRNKPISLKDLPSALEKSGVDHEATIPIKVRDLTDLRGANELLVYLRLKGYTRAILVTRRHGISTTTNGSGTPRLSGDRPARQRSSMPAATPAPQRYRMR